VHLLLHAREFNHSTGVCHCHLIAASFYHHFNTIIITRLSIFTGRALPFFFGVRAGAQGVGQSGSKRVLSLSRLESV
jgi:hypothetical protein